MLRPVILGLAALVIPAPAAPQLGPEHPDDGFMSGAGVRVEDATSICVTSIQPAPDDVVTYSRCTLVDVDTLVTASDRIVFAARYMRWIRSSAASWVDSLQVDEVVLLEADDIDAPTALTVWHRVGFHNFLGQLEWGQHGEVYLLQLYNCVRGTGGCVEDILARNESGWSALELAFVAELGQHLPAGYRLHKGRRIDLSTLGFEQPISKRGDPNCCPSASLTGTLRLDGLRLRLDSVEPTARRRATW